MEILFKNKTKYTKQIYSDYQQFHQKKYGLKYEFTTIVTILLLCFCIFANTRYYNYLTALILFIVLGFFCFYRFFYPIKKVEKELKTEKFVEEKEFTFEFYEKYFMIYDKKTPYKMKYSQLYKVFETDNAFYLYINRDHAFLLNKSTFSVGNISEFLKFLKKKIWYKL